jgi:cytochrome c551/c552
MRRNFMLSLTLTLSSLFACYQGDDFALGARANASGGPGTGSSGSSGNGFSNSAPSGLPCDVESVLTRNSCLNCHGATLSAPMPLLSYADLTASAKSNAAKKVAELVVTRMRDAASPMPPQGLAPAADADVIQAWIAAGYPKGTCGASAGDGGAAGDGSSPQVVVQCTSATYWTGGNDKSPQMNPGKACVTCHTSDPDIDQDAPRVVGGTLYPTFYEPDLCNGFSGATVVRKSCAVRNRTAKSNASARVSTCFSASGVREVNARSGFSAAVA